MGRPFRSYIAWRKTRQTLRVPAGDPSDSEECECGNFLLTEDGQPLQTENTQLLSPEA